jgi:hypothetical protein
MVNSLLINIFYSEGIIPQGGVSQFQGANGMERMELVEIMETVELISPPRRNYGRSGTPRKGWTIPPLIKSKMQQMTESQLFMSTATRTMEITLLVVFIWEYIRIISR